jgi:hypothetical protein
MGSLVMLELERPVGDTHSSLLRAPVKYGQIFYNIGSREGTHTLAYCEHL